jgi:D-tyrosyl-tRNA(Tyr) deacylase
LRALVQRVRQASVTVNGHEVGSINQGLVVFVAVAKDDEPADAEYIVNKVSNLRIFPNEDGRFGRSALEVNAALLVISQFTLYANTRRGRRPSFSDAAPPETAGTTFDDVLNRFRSTGLTIATSAFQERMDVSLINNGPVTIWIDSLDGQRPRK